MLKINGNLESGELTTLISKFSWGQNKDSNSVAVSFEMFGFDFGTLSYTKEPSDQSIHKDNIVMEQEVAVESEGVEGVIFKCLINEYEGKVEIQLNVAEAGTLETWSFNKQESSAPIQKWLKEEKWNQKIADKDYLLLQDCRFSVNWDLQRVFLAGSIGRESSANSKSLKRFEVTFEWE